MEKITAIILNWNRAQDTIECIKSAMGMELIGVDFNIICIDNASTDDSVAVLSNTFKRYLDADKLRIIENRENLGFAAGNNLGVKYAWKFRPDYVLLLNNDTVVDTSLVSELIRAAKQNPQAGCLSPKIYFARGYEFHKEQYKPSELGRVIWYAGGDIDWNNVYCINYGVDKVDNGQFDNMREIQFATGACELLTAQVLRKTGGFDDKYFMYLEDADLSMRIRRNGYKVVFVPKAKLWHKVAQSSGIGSGLNDYFITRNRLLFGMRYAPFRSKIALCKESIRFLLNGRDWQKRGVTDFFLNNMGKGSWCDGKK